MKDKFIVGICTSEPSRRLWELTQKTSHYPEDSWKCVIRYHCLTSVLLLRPLLTDSRRVCWISSLYSSSVWLISASWWMKLVKQRLALSLRAISPSWVDEEMAPHESGYDTFLYPKAETEEYHWTQHNESCRDSNSWELSYRNSSTKLMSIIPIREKTF